MNYKLKIHFIVKNFFLRLDSIGLLPNFVKKLSIILSEVSNNYSFDRRFNGENMIIQKLYKSNIDIQIVFDVGANKGYWSKYFYNIFLKSRFYLFEITPSRLKILAKIKINSFKVLKFGLGCSNKSSYFYDYPSLDGENSFFNTRPDIKSKKILAKFKKGDLFCKNYKIKKIDFLKIDVEGMELEVLRGFNKMIKKKQIEIIQFEYSIANSISSFMFYELFKFFNKNDYVVGKLTNTGVKFISEFKVEMNNFKFGPNFIACPKSKKNLIKVLSSF